MFKNEIMVELAEIERQIRRVEEKLDEVDRKRDKVYWFVPIAIVVPLLMPFVPKRGVTMAEKYGYMTVVMWTSLLLLVVMPIAYIVQKNQLDKEEGFLEEELENLRKKKLNLKK